MSGFGTVWSFDLGSRERAERFLAGARAGDRGDQLRRRAHDGRAARALGRRRRARGLHPAVRRLRGHGRPGRRRGARARRGVSALLVTGGSGYLGRELLRRDPTPWALVRRAATSADGGRGAARRSSRLRPERWSTPPTGATTARRPSTARVHVARAAAAVGARLVHLSTDVVFDGEKGSPYAEEDEPAPVTDYGRDKADAERAVLEAYPGALVVRTSLIYGGPRAGAAGAAGR